MKLVCAVAFCLLCSLLFSLAFGCVYTVRDVGFADVGSTPYRLYYYIRSDTPEELISTFKQISYAALMDSNVEALIINVDQPETDLDREENSVYDQAIQFLFLHSLSEDPVSSIILLF